jgi:methyltransferase (TIGR00027 family)
MKGASMYETISNIIQNQFCTTHNTNNAKPSSQAVAVWRAVHQLLEHPSIFNDPVALTILGDAKTDVMNKLESYKDPLSAAMRVAIAVRSRFAEDEREKALQAGSYQYVILGAGLDTYAYRSTNQHERVFEVDLPSTQSMKIARLQQEKIHSTCALTYVACDFEAGALEKSLLVAGFDKNQKTFFSWLGVVPYLDAAAIEHTLKFIRSCARGSALVFDYMVDPNNLSEIEKMTITILSAQLASGGEPLKSFFDPQVLAEKLSGLEFSQVGDISPDYLNEQYLALREDGLRVGNVTRMFNLVV